MTGLQSYSQSSKQTAISVWALEWLSDLTLKCSFLEDMKSEQGDLVEKSGKSGASGSAEGLWRVYLVKLGAKNGQLQVALKAVLSV